MESPRIDLRYLKEAFREPINLWGMVGFATLPVLMGLGIRAMLVAGR